jgi:hypothetical protein
MNIISKIINAFNAYYFLSNSEKKYCKINKLRWSKNLIKFETKKIILVDLFPWSPWIHIWSHLTNYLAKKNEAQIHFFYFHLKIWKSSNFKIFYRRIIKIYNSFNAKKGIFELDFDYTNKEKIKFERLFKEYKINKKKLISYKENGIKIGDLIYDSYLRSTFEPTVNLESAELKKTFFRALKIISEIDTYFKKFDVQAVLPSHTCYISYGIITRYALKNNIPVYAIHSGDKGSVNYKIIKLKKNFPYIENPYFEYKKLFKKIPNKEKKFYKQIGKKNILNRVSGKLDKSMPYIKKSLFTKHSGNKFFGKTNKKKIFFFPHCYVDNPHRYRSMLFADFYEQSKYILQYSNHNFELFYKPHPNEIETKNDVHKKMKKMFPKIKILPKNLSHHEIIKHNPYLIITNHGTICHEYAYFNVPVINTGDNPHINYNFSLNPKNLKQLDDMIFNLDSYIKKISFDKNSIYEFIYMHYYYFEDTNKKFFKDKYFSKGNLKSHFIKHENFDIFHNQNQKVSNNIAKYFALSKL